MEQHNLSLHDKVGALNQTNLFNQLPPNVQTILLSSNKQINNG